MKKTGRLSIMKKALSLVLLLSGLLLYGCGVGGGTSATSDGSNATSNPGGSPGGPQPQTGAAQGFTLHLIDAEKADVALATTFTSTTNPVLDNAPDAVRIVVRLYSRVTISHQDCVYPSYDGEGYGIGTPTCTEVGVPIDTEVYKTILDQGYTGSSVSVDIPASTGYPAGYTIDVITSKGTPTHNILKYGQAKNVQVDSSNKSANIVISDVGRQLNMQVADNILSSASTHTVQFNVTVNNGLPFASAWSADMTFGGTTTSLPSFTKNLTFDAPISDQGGEVSMKGHFDLQNIFLKVSDKPKTWIRDFPYLSDESITYNLNPLIPVTIL